MDLSNAIIEDNNIIIEKYLNIDDIIKQEKIEVDIGEQMFIINRSQLRFVEYQKIILYSSGIPLINHRNIYCIENKGNIIILVHIKF